MNPVLPLAVSGERFEFESLAGRLSAYVAGSGAPLLLVHSINASASAAEVRTLHEHYRATRTVFSIDLPGYGFSERSDRDYTPRLMTDALHAMVGHIRSRCGSVPIDALAVSLSCEYLARAAVEVPAQYRSVALVSPTGLDGRRARRGEPGSTRGLPWLYRMLRGPGSVWGGALFRGLTRPGVIRYFLERTWGGRKIDEELWRYDLLTTRQPGAEFAPLHFLSAGLFSADIHTLYEQLAMPVWMCHGDRGDFTNYRGKVIVQDQPNWQFSMFPAGALPYFELPDRFSARYDEFLAAAAAGTSR
jgi:pimeloyl-ACP methyl ester carboxylesterase